MPTIFGWCLDTDYHHDKCIKSFDFFGTEVKCECKNHTPNSQTNIPATTESAVQHNSVGAVQPGPQNGSRKSRKVQNGSASLDAGEPLSVQLPPDSEPVTHKILMEDGKHGDRPDATL